MTHLIFIPIIFILAIVKLLSDRYNLNLIDFIAKVAIWICIILFLYFFMDYQGFNVIVYLRSLFYF